MRKLVPMREYLPEGGSWHGELFAHCLTDEKGEYIAVMERVNHHGDISPRVYDTYASARRAWDLLKPGERAITAIFRFVPAERVDERNY